MKILKNKNTFKGIGISFNATKSITVGFSIFKWPWVHKGFHETAFIAIAYTGIKDWLYHCHTYKVRTGKCYQCRVLCFVTAIKVLDTRVSDES